MLGFNQGENDVKQGTDQITTFNHLAFKRVSDKPDGWYLPEDKGSLAIILETKSAKEKEDVSNAKWIEELRKNIDIVAT